MTYSKKGSSCKKGSDPPSNPPEASAMSIVQGELKGLAIQEHEITQP